MAFIKNPGFILRISISIGYIMLGIMLSIHPSVISFLSVEMTYIFCSLLVIYGLFRGYRAYEIYQKTEKEK